MHTRRTTQSSRIALREQSVADWLSAMRAGGWEQGQHVAIIGPTGCGKTTIAGMLLATRGSVVGIGIKAKDAALQQYEQLGYATISRWPPRPRSLRRVVLWVPPGSGSTDPDKDKRCRHDTILEALQAIEEEGSWAVSLDDTGYLAGRLGLSGQITSMLDTGRSSDVSLVCLLQKPSDVAHNISPAILSQVRHKLIFGPEDDRDLQRLSELAGLTPTQFAAARDALGERDFIARTRASRIIVRNTA